MEAQAERSAPEPLDLVEAFVNTADLERHSDEIGTPGALQVWLQARQLIGRSQRVTLTDHRYALQLREALRRAARANNGDRVDAHHLRQLNQLARRGSLVLSFAGDGTARLDPAATGVDAALGRILAAVADSMLSGRWSRLKSCANDGCQWVFYDASKNRSGRWCDMADCGNEAKSRAFRNRHRLKTQPARATG